MHCIITSWYICRHPRAVSRKNLQPSIGIRRDFIAPSQWRNDARKWLLPFLLASTRVAFLQKLHGASSSIVPWLHKKKQSLEGFVVWDFLHTLKVEFLHASFHHNWNQRIKNPPWYTQCQSGNIEGVVSPWQLLLLVQVLVHQSQLFCTAPQVTNKKSIHPRHHVLSEFFFKSWSNFLSAGSEKPRKSYPWFTSLKHLKKVVLNVALCCHFIHLQLNRVQTMHRHLPKTQRLLLHLDALATTSSGSPHLGPYGFHDSKSMTQTQVQPGKLVPQHLQDNENSSWSTLTGVSPKQLFFPWGKIRSPLRPSTGLGPWSHQDKPGRHHASYHCFLLQMSK